MPEPVSVLEIVLASSVVAGMVSAFVSTWTSQRKISIENITQERTKWREIIRAKSLEAHNAFIDKDKKKLSQLKLEFSLILNPKDDEDNGIIESIRLPEDGKEEELSLEFSKRVSLLLKHDWERVKLEAGSIFLRIKIINIVCKLLLKKAKREHYSA
jgi:hypothetical protein